MKVLYVEDNPANVFLVKRVARMGNHEIINYIDGDKALEKFDEIDPDLVLMDIQLAGNKSGLDVVRALRERGAKQPIIAVTAYAMVGDKERCIEAGCDDYLPKPLPIQRLVEMFKEYAEAAAKKRAEASPEPEKVAETTPGAIKATVEQATTPESAVKSETETVEVKEAPESPAKTEAEADKSATSEASAVSTTEENPSAGSTNKTIQTQAQSQVDKVSEATKLPGNAKEAPAGE